jgi:hypothetical protein
MPDVETNVRPDSSRPSFTNPYSGQEHLLPAHHPFNILRRIIYMSVSFYALLHFKFYRTILHSPNIRHEWFKIGLATTIGKLDCCTS